MGFFDLSSSRLNPRSPRRALTLVEDSAQPVSGETDDLPPSRGFRMLANLLERHEPQALLTVPLPSNVAGDLRNVVRQLCLEAKASNPHGAEFMVIGLHKIWPTLPLISRGLRTPESSSLLALIVTRCVREYYKRSPEGDDASSLTFEQAD
jgi:hypothetical protein